MNLHNKASYYVQKKKTVTLIYTFLELPSFKIRQWQFHIRSIAW